MSARLFIKFAKKWYPLPDGYAESGPSLYELRPIYRKWKFAALALFFPSIAVCTFGWWLAFHQLAEWHARSYEPAAWHLYNTDTLIALPAFFLGIVSGGYLLTWFLRLLLRERRELYLRYEKLDSGADVERASRPIILGIASVALLFMLAAINWHVVFQPRGVTFHSWFGLGTVTRSYQDVKDIRTAPQRRAPNGKLVDRREYEIEFVDGSIWTTNFEPSGLSNQEKERLAKFISRQSTRRIRELKVLE